jgi:3-methyladenine DNA glycosylase AlkD
MSSACIESLIKELEANRNAADAEAMRAYMRNQFQFYGIKAPKRKAICKAFQKQHGLPPVENVNEIVLDLWRRPERECQYSAMWLLERMRKKLPAETIDLIETLILTKSWWDTVDFLSSHDTAFFFEKFPQTKASHLPAWRKSENFWLRRAALLFQLRAKGATDKELLFDIVRENTGSDEFFINKAIGWALRTYSQVDAPAVIEFVQSTPLHPLSEREALKWLKSKGKYI